MKKLNGKTILLLILAVLICVPSVAMLILDSSMWIASIFGFAAAIILVIIVFSKKKKTYTAILTFVTIESISPQNVTWALCELRDKQFKLAIPPNVYKAEKLIPCANYKVDYTAISNDTDPTTSGLAVKMKISD